MKGIDNELLAANVKLAVAGDSDALDNVLFQIKDPVYNLALRMLWHPDDAEDAAQEILIRVVTHLSQFKGESKFTTWVYRIAANHVINFKNARGRGPTFEEFSDELKQGLGAYTDYDSAGVEQRLLIEEAKVGCSNAMLQCLTAEARLVYILGEILELPGPVAGAALDMPPANFRKQLSRARERLHNFLAANCGLAGESNACRCSRRVEYGKQVGRIQPDKLLFQRGKKSDTLLKTIKNLEEAATIYRTNAELSMPEAAVARIKAAAKL